VAVRLELAGRSEDAERSVGAGYASGIGRGLVGIGWLVEPVGQVEQAGVVGQVALVGQVVLVEQIEQVAWVGCSYLVLVATKT
jgi:hypothetical protein